MIKFGKQFVLFASIFAFGVCVTACSEPRPVMSEDRSIPSLTPKWKIDGGFTSPESAIYDPARDVVYVSNVAGYTENGLGYISTINVNGGLIEERWLEGINAPTGMAITGDVLYVADFNQLVAIDIPSASISQIYEVDVENPGMNDVTISPAGDVFVSASAISTIYQLKDGQLAIWAQSDALQFANGLFADDEYLYVAGYYLRRLGLASREIEAFGDDEILIDLESIETDHAGGFFASQIGDKPIMHVTADGDVSALLETGTFTADMDYVHGQNILIAPSGGDTVSGFTVHWNEK